ncbi:pimeloyl-ACP methyl ester carboxylesterase [Pedobacter sp. W3I1]|uniref:alpha/beta hydrolase n=1 Tax=Pedobacter sp. W3I1 TaxID=3042291 RepID=UPI00277DB824|nr:alpha/beta hydrolase [Pedobacter sp. W3I1]MDQ0639718.1 pimeloyl-ACP methyl ester carboxylesterase [Pedobacter sp. W3I1]
MKTIKFYALSLLALVLNTGIYAQNPDTEKPTIIFVHGIWADGSSFSYQISALQAKGYQVISVQNPITSLADDVAATQRAINQVKGKVILVGHSWGGFVITQAGNDPKVVGMVYLAAYGPDLGESLLAVSANGPKTELTKYLTPTNGFVYISEEGVKSVFANDLNQKQQALVYATQTPAFHTVFEDKSAAPAWKNKPSWYVVATNDKTISPDLERFMAKRMKAKTIEIASGHVIMISNAKEVLKVIEEAANAK